MKYKILFALIILCALIFPGVMAANITITAEPLGGSLNVAPSGMTEYTVDVSALQRNAIQRITVDVPTGSTVDYTIWYGNGTTLSGQMIYNPAPGMCGLSPLCQFSQVSIGSSVANHYYVGIQEQGRINIVGYGRNEDTQERVFIVYDMGSLLVHLSGDPMAYTPVPSGVIYKVHLSSNKPMTSLNYYTNTKENVNKASTTSLLDAVSDWWNAINQIKDAIFDVFWFFYYGFEFFWDNWSLISVLYIAGTGAVCVCQAKSVFGAIERWFGYQRKLLDFILGFIRNVTGLISQFIK